MTPGFNRTSGTGSRCPRLSNRIGTPPAAEKYSAQAGLQPLPQSGEPHSMVSQSANPVSAVRTVTSSPTTSASHQPPAAAMCATPITLATAITVAAVYAPIVASVSGG